MKLKRIISVINDMQAAGVIGRYAIGGAVAATFYLEPVATLDLDIFVALQPEPGQLILTPKKIYDFLTARGWQPEGEYLVIEGWPVQFLPPTGPLLDEALADARETDVDGERTFVLSAEHLVAIALETGRAKDRQRILQFVEAGGLNRDKLGEILKRHGLSERWTRFEQQYLTGPS